MAHFVGNHSGPRARSETYYLSAPLSTKRAPAGDGGAADGSELDAITTACADLLKVETSHRVAPPLNAGAHQGLVGRRKGRDAETDVSVGPLVGQTRQVHERLRRCAEVASARRGAWVGRSNVDVSFDEEPIPPALSQPILATEFDLHPLSFCNRPGCGGGEIALISARHNGERQRCASQTISSITHACLAWTSCLFREIVCCSRKQMRGRRHLLRTSYCTLPRPKHQAGRSWRKKQCQLRAEWRLALGIRARESTEAMSESSKYRCKTRDRVSRQRVGLNRMGRNGARWGLRSYPIAIEGE
jgi:hypothetical protein